MKTQRIVYFPKVILPIRKKDSDNNNCKVKHFSKNAALLSAALLALAANAKAVVQNGNEENPKTNIVVNCETPENIVVTQTKTKNEDINKENEGGYVGGLLLLLLAGGMFVTTILDD